MLLKNGKAPTYPELKKGLSSDENIALWNGILEEMIFPFDYHSNPEPYEDMEYDEKELKMKKGLVNFAKHFKDLWI